MNRLVTLSIALSMLALTAACAPAVKTGTTPAGTARPAATAKPAELVFPDEAFRAKQPAPGPIAKFEQPALARFKLANGIDVFLAEQHELPTVSMQLVLPGGAVNDAPGKEGTAYLCMSLMSEGTEALGKIEFNEQLADLASSVTSSASTDEQTISLKSLSRNLDRTLDLWADTILEPGLRKEELERNVKSRLETIRQSKGSADGLASRVGGSIAWGESHPLGMIVTEASTKAITLDDCRAHVRGLKPAGAKLFVVGDVTKKQIEEKVGSRLQGWTGAPKKVPLVGPAKPRAGRVFFVDVPGAQQSVLRLTHPGPARNAKDYVATELLSLILGGSFSSRINMNIREAKGYAYGAAGGFNYSRNAGLFTAGASVRSDVTVESVQEILVEMKKIRDENVTELELTRERQGAILSLPASFATGADVLQSYKRLDYYGLPLDWYSATYLPGLTSATVADVRKAATTHLAPDELRFLVVGDAKTVLPKLEAFAKEQKLGEIVTLDGDGRRVAK